MNSEKVGVVSKKEKKRKNQSKNISGESQQKVRVSDTHQGDIPRLSSHTINTGTGMQHAHSTPTPTQQQQAIQSQGQYSPYALPPPPLQSQFSSYMSPIPAAQANNADIFAVISDLSRKFDKMNSKLATLDLIDKRMTKIEVNMSEVSGDIKGVKSQVIEMDKSLNMLNALCEEKKNSLKTAEKGIKNLADQTTALQKEHTESKTAIDHLRHELITLKEDHLDLQARSMRDNLIFDGIPEEREENTEEVLVGFLSNEMGLTETFQFERVHRMGKPRPGKPRPIIAKFSAFKQKETVRKAAPRTLRGKSFGVNEQFPREIADRRKQLLPHLRAAKRQQKKAYLRLDKLYINDRLFEPTTMETGSQNHHKTT